MSGIVWTLRDVTRERMIKRQMMQTEKLSALGQIVAGVAHELNNPLTSVIGFAQMLSLQPVATEMKQDIERIIDQAKRAARIVQNLLVFARDREPELLPTDLNTILREVIEMRAYEMEVANIRAALDLAPALPTVRADPYQLQQVFFNLVLNAEQAITGAARVEGRLLVRSRLSAPGMIRVEVRDNGLGIPADRLKRIFDPFYTTKEVGQGTGLGLSICYGIVEEHGGRVWAESEMNVGTSLIVELPAQDAGAAASAQTRETATPYGTPVDAPSTEEGAGQTLARILVIDDEETITSLLDRALRRWGYEPVVAKDGYIAWRMIESGPFDLILSDLRMPGLGARGC